ncbi:MAG: cytochrome c oxidase assembly protein [Solirubrobacteraceae bacterium]|jgi:cytochrome c oxidase assembly factor CtaG
MSVHALVSDWSVDGSAGVAFAVALAAAGFLYLMAAAVGTHRDRRARRWPWRRSACFLAGLAVLAIDLYSGIGTEADTRLSAHMLEHMIMWLVVAPLLAAGGPVRLALFALPREGRRTLGRWLHSRALTALTGPIGSVSVFSAVLLVSHIPAVYGLTLRSDGVHELEHGLYLGSALLLWAPLLGVDPLPHRPGPRGQAACTIACMLPMAGLALWLLSAPSPVYAHYLGTLGGGALADQRLAGAIMLFGGVPAFALAPLARRRIPGARRTPIVAGRQVAA